MLIVKDLSASPELDHKALAELRRGLSLVKKDIYVRWVRGKGVANQDAFTYFSFEAAENNVEYNDS